MEIIELEKHFCELQKDNKLFDVKYKEWPLWFLIKSPLFNTLVNNLVASNKNNKSNFISFNFLSNFFIGCLEWIKYLVVKKRNNNILMIYRSEVRVKQSDGKYKYPFGDDVITKKNRKYFFILEETNLFKNIPHPLTQCDLKGEFINFFILIGGKLLPPILNFNEKKSEILAIIKNKYAPNSEILDEISKAFSNKLVEKSIVKFEIQRIMYSHLIKIIKPKVILLLFPQGYLGLLAIAKKNNIEIVEIQHGAFSEYHQAYNWPTYLKIKNDNILLPNKILLWGKYWAENLLKRGFWEENQLLSLGNLRIEEGSENLNQSDIARSYTTILFTSQRPIAIFAISFWEGVLKQIKNQNLKIKLVIKLHPDEMSMGKEYKKLVDLFPNNCVVYNHLDKSLYDLFKTCDMHISVFSTALHESLALSIPTFILGLKGHEYMDGLLKNDISYLIDSTEKLIEIANNKLELNRIRIALKKSDYYYSPNPIKNYLQFLMRYNENVCL